MPTPSLAAFRPFEAELTKIGTLTRVEILPAIKKKNTCTTRETTFAIPCGAEKYGA
ncbi:hypothetical protein [Algoriphagus boritolerans]|uniref:hypothetical protein n=1 Tax=Algoriphagus boritolerans TaxID=308111 RepID=UPI002FCE5B44